MYVNLIHVLCAEKPFRNLSHLSLWTRTGFGATVPEPDRPDRLRQSSRYGSGDHHIGDGLASKVGDSLGLEEGEHLVLD